MPNKAKGHPQPPLPTSCLLSSLGLTRSDSTNPHPGICHESQGVTLPPPFLACIYFSRPWSGMGARHAVLSRPAAAHLACVPIFFWRKSDSQHDRDFTPGRSSIAGFEDTGTTAHEQPLGAESSHCRQPAGNRNPQIHSCKALDSASTLKELGSKFFTSLQIRAPPANPFIST